MSLPLTHGDWVASVRTFSGMEEVDLEAPAPHVIVLDYWLGGERVPSIDYVPALVEWGAQVVLYTSEESPHLLQAALKAGVLGVCLKRDGIDALVAAISAVGRGTPVLSSVGARALIDDQALAARLTPAEIEVLRAIAYGKTTKQIADALFVEPSTIDTHVEHIRSKFAESSGTKVNRVSMAVMGLRLGYIPRNHLLNDPENT